MPYAPALQPVMPATVLLAHPVVVAAEHEAAARWSDIGVARAQRLPQIDLTALLTGQWLRALGTSAHFDTWSAGASLAGPLFDGGAGAANVRGAEARYRQALANLRSVLRSTAQDIEDALAAQSAAEERTVTAAQELDAAQMTLHANEERWRVGAISMFELQIARRQLTNANEDAIAAVRDRAIAWVNLVRASNSTSPRADERGVGSLSSSHDTAAASTFTSSTW
jgi:outer membrane protein TolC